MGVDASSNNADFVGIEMFCSLSAKTVCIAVEEFSLAVDVEETGIIVDVVKVAKVYGI